MKQRSVKKIVLTILAVVLSLLVLVIGGVVFLFRHEIKSLSSFETIDDNKEANVLYAMTYDGDYGLDEFLSKGAQNDQELVDFIIKKMLKGLPIELDIPDLGCSTYQAQLENGDYVFGRNFDLTYAPALLVKTTPKNGYSSISMVNLGFLGFGQENLPETLTGKILTLAAPYIPLDGINEAGLTIGVLQIEDEPTNQNTDKVDITTTTAIRMVLDKAATVDEAVKMLEQYDMHSSANSSYHFQISDASGTSVVVEYVDNQFSVVKPDKPYQAATNFLLSPEKYNFGHGQDRYEIMMSGLERANGVLPDTQSAMDLLQAASQDLHRKKSGETSGTQWSVVYNNTTLTAEIIVGRQYEKEAYVFSLEK